MYSLVPDEVASLVFEVFLEVEALNEAVAKASLLSGQEASSLKRHEAALCALRQSVCCLVVLELLTLILSENLEIKLSLGHFDFLLIINLIN